MNPLSSYVSECDHGVSGSRLGTPCVIQSIVIQLSKYTSGTEPDLDKTHRALSARKAHKRTTVLLQDRCNFYVLYETDKTTETRIGIQMSINYLKHQISL